MEKPIFPRFPPALAADINRNTTHLELFPSVHTQDLMSDSDSSGLSSAPSVDDEFIVPTRGKDGMLQFLTKARVSSPPADDDERPNPRKRAPSPPHEYVLADNPDIAVRVSPPLETGSVSRRRIVLTRDMMHSTCDWLADS